MKKTMKKFCITKKSRIFATHYIRKGGHTRLFATGFFYALLLTIYGFVPPCRALMRRLPFRRCSATGQAEPFFSPPERHFKAMHTATKTASRDVHSPKARVTHETRQSTNGIPAVAFAAPIRLSELLKLAPREAILIAAFGIRKAHSASIELVYELAGARYHYTCTQEGGQP